jgi:spore coat protein A
MKNLTRRDFLKAGAVGGAGLLLPLKWNPGTALAFAQSDGLAKFIQPLRGNGVVSLVTEIGVAAPDLTPAPITGVTHYTVGIGEFVDQLHPQLTNGTRLWGFQPTRYLAASPPGFRHLGGIIVAQRGTPIQVSFVNNLPPTHILPVDDTLMGANTSHNRTAIHLHGGYVPWISDGGPFDWFEPASPGRVGPSFLNNAVLNPGAAPGTAEYYYPNDQSARFVWYHDHAIGITRLNAYAGIASGYIIRDAFESSLVPLGLPDFIENGGYELPIVVQDKTFVSSTTALTDPTWFTLRPTSVLGDLWYTHVYDPKLYKLKGNKKGNRSVPNPSAVPEFFGDTMLANGTVYPEAVVEGRRYRFRILNACNARFLNLQLYVDDGSADSITLNALTLSPTNPPGPGWLQIGTEGGFLPVPVSVPSNVPFNPLTLTGSLILGPAERADVIVDFGAFVGRKLVLYTDAPAPFPVGSPLNDYFPEEDEDPVITTPGFGPNTRQIMRFSVVAPTGSDLPLNLPVNFTPGLDPFPVTQIPGMPTPNPAGVPVRLLTLNETFDAFGRLIQLLGTNVPPVNAGQGLGRGYIDPTTEVVNKDATEVWEILNLTEDTHPMHFHLVNVQVLARQAFNAENYNGGLPTYIGPPAAPALNEIGWKETVRMNPDEATRILIQFKLPTVPFAVPSSPRANTAPGNLGITVPAGRIANEYVWHCHILEHEEHDMMRSLVVIS